MKRVVCIAMAFIVCIAMFGTVVSAKNEFVPSISYKDSPTIVPVKPDKPSDTPQEPGKVVVGEIVDKDKGEKVEDVHSEQIVVTPVAGAEGSTDIPQESKNQLIEVYDKLESGDMTLPYDKVDTTIEATDMVIRDLFDVSIVDEEKNELLLQENTTIVITFDLGISSSTEVICMVYVNDEWIPAVSVVNNGDGTVTVELSNTGILAFSVNASDVPPAQTGDTVGADLPVWIGVMGFAFVALIIVLIVGNRKKEN